MGMIVAMVILGVLVMRRRMRKRTIMKMLVGNAALMAVSMVCRGIEAILRVRIVTIIGIFSIHRHTTPYS